MRKLLSILAALLLTFPLRGQENASEILHILGGTDLEMLDEQVLDRFEAFAHSPIKLNLSSRRSLLGSGLLTPYQTASLLEYRREYGDILSYTELAAIDGFGEETARALRPFTSLYSNGLPASAGSDRLKGGAMVQSGLQNIAAKVKLSRGDRLGAGASWKRAWEGGGGNGLFITYAPSRIDLRVTAGDFNVRFGQGAVLWSGFSLTGVSTPEAFGKRPTGISPTSSWAGTSLRGLAGEFSAGKYTFSAFAASPWLRTFSADQKKLSAGLNVTRFSRHGSVGATLFFGEQTLKAGADARFCLKGVDLFAEATWDFRARAPGAVAGGSFRIKEVRLSLLGRYYGKDFSSESAGAIRASSKTSDEAGAAIGLGWKSFTLTADASRKLSSGKNNLKIIGAGEFTLSPLLKLKVRLTERLRNYSPVNRTDLRGDLCLTTLMWAGNLRLNLVHSEGTSFLSYLEGGYKGENAAAWLRGTLFFADNWNDRIYSYERDVPGSFNVPAYYGRGFSLSAYGGGKLRLGRTVLKAYLRLSWTDYPMMKEKKPGSAGLKGYISVDF